MKTTLTALTVAVLLVVPATGSPAISPAISAAISTTTSSGGEAEAFARERGIPVAEAERRLGWQSLAADLQERLEADPASFGGVWIDQCPGDRVKVGDTGGGAAAVKRAADAVGLTTRSSSMS